MVFAWSWGPCRADLALLCLGHVATLHPCAPPPLSSQLHPSICLLGSQAVSYLVEHLPNVQLLKMSASLLSLKADSCLSFQLLLRQLHSLNNIGSRCLGLCWSNPIFIITGVHLGVTPLCTMPLASSTRCRLNPHCYLGPLVHDILKPLILETL